MFIVKAISDHDFDVVVMSAQEVLAYNGFNALIDRGWSAIEAAAFVFSLRPDLDDEFLNFLVGDK